ncbi:hypothetical protein D9758_012165 [Tetrapyrgos nigripes]|uniref:FAD-binding PCMH-type domain-containing protein n=1 Tax=Tetrapyrgos nigripes TaxID=182062 RepID=A0A8H5FL76_9AGAR|nr:hypothetical protein D9758_012165 [Tetrapyrgos nigripes]
MLSLLVPLACLALSRASQTPLNVPKDKGPGLVCCTSLSETLPNPSIVHFPGSSEYEAQQKHYYILQQTELNPSCRISPTTSSEVSLIVKTLTKHDCPFAVRSGGHMSWTAANSAGGVTLDLGQLNGVDVDEEKGVVRLGPGSTWKRVYTVMEGYNVTTAGARMTDVGGISLLSFQHGFGSDNVANYEVVLADGSIVNANATSHPDLFWALKLGSTNYGIVTRFDTFTYPLKDVWSGLRVYPVTSQETPQLLENWATFSRNVASLKDELQFLVLGRHRQDNVDERIVVWHGSLDTTPTPPLTPAASTHDTTRATTLLGFLEDLTGFDEQKRTRWSTFTVKIDAAFLWDTFSRMKEIFDELEYVSGLQWDLCLQPIAQSFLTASSKTGGNPFRKVLMESEDDLAIVEFIISWRNKADDEAMYNAIRKLTTWGEDTARQRGIFNSFIYLNYASDEQPVYARSVNRDDLARMRKVKLTYDSEDVLGRLWKGGFKLPHDSSDEHWYAARTEL